MPTDGKLPPDEAEQFGALLFRVRCRKRKAPFVATAMKGVLIMSAKRLSRNAVLAAMCAVLGAVSLDLGNLKITLEALPVIMGALMFGPVDGMAIGFVGTFVYQLLRYGVSATTLLWILPYVVCGLIVGLYAKRHSYKLNTWQTILIAVIAELVITTLNTGVLYIDSKIYGYYSAVYIFGTLLPRYAICVGKAAAEGAILPLLISALDKLGHKGAIRV